VNKVKRIAIVGPECTGKTSLSKSLAHYYQTHWVPEYARLFLDQLDREYVQHDLLQIAKGQLAAEDTLALNAKNILICDTNLIVIKIWSEFNYGNCDPEILKLLNQRSYDLHLLTQIDIPWENDPQREHPNEREALFKIYKSELEKLKVPFVEIHGNQESRKLMAIQAIDEVLNRP
jgi:NadR type nicotinamide-nucleotide adenylyltransferase